MTKTTNAIASGPDTVETFAVRGVEYVGLNVCPRGFGNEFSVYVVPAGDAAKVAALQAKRERARERQPGDGYSADWLSARQLQRHIFGSKARDGQIYLLTVREGGERDAFVL